MYTEDLTEDRRLALPYYTDLNKNKYREHAIMYSTLNNHSIVMALVRALLALLKLFLHTHAYARVHTHTHAHIHPVFCSLSDVHVSCLCKRDLYIRRKRPFQIWVSCVSFFVNV